MVATMQQRRPRICLNMIVRNEAHIIEELIDSVAPWIDCWVIVDTGSDDGTQDVIRRLMADRGIPGVLYERSWRDFGHNRTEALRLAQGQAEYIWVLDADDVLVGRLDFSGLSADSYWMCYEDGLTYWRRQLFRDGLPWRFKGVLHEVAVSDEPFDGERLEGDYCIRSRRLGHRNQDPLKYARDAQILQAEVARNPDDARSVFYLAQSYRDAGNYEQARHWYARRAEMGGWAEEVFCALLRIAEAMEALGEPWSLVQEAYLRAWSARPTRAEPLYAVARRCRIDGNYQLGHLFGRLAAEIPFPAGDTLFVNTTVYQWRALDEQAVCASWLGLWSETHTLCERLLARGDIPDDERSRIAGNRDLALTHLPSQKPAEGPLRQALMRRLLGKTIASGELRLPAVPALLDDYRQLCENSFALLGVNFSGEQSAHLRTVLDGQLAAAWEASQRSEIVISYDVPTGLSVNYKVKTRALSLGETYDNWVATRQPPLFGTHPDARVWALASEAPDPAAWPVLDIGAGTGRNALALARRGHPVDAIELSCEFASRLRAEAGEEGLALRVLERDVFASTNDLRADYQLMVLSEVMTDFRTADELRRVFELAETCLAAGGRLVCNLFLPREGYEPDAFARELGQQLYTAIFTRDELDRATADRCLQLVGDDSVFAYEKQHLPEEAWPPTGWYINWIHGLDLFDVSVEVRSPIELRWLVYRKSADKSV